MGAGMCFGSRRSRGADLDMHLASALLHCGSRDTSMHNPGSGDHPGKITKLQAQFSVSRCGD